MSVQLPGTRRELSEAAEGNTNGNGRGHAPVATPPQQAPHPPVSAPSPAVVLPEEPARRRRPAFMTRRVLLPILAVILLVVAYFGFNAWRESSLYVSTDNAQLSGQPVQVGSMNAGRVEAIMPSIGSPVHKGD